MKSELCVASRNIPRPVFIPGKPVVCLGMLNGWFSTSTIVDEVEKFYYTHTALPSDVALEMQDFAIHYTTGPYIQFRKALTAHTGLTDRQHFQVIFETVENMGFFQ